MGSGVSRGRQNNIFKFIRKRGKEIMKEKSILRIICALLIPISLLIVSVSGLITEPPSNNITIILNQGILGNINEGQTMFYTPSNTSSLNDIVIMTNTQANISLYLDTDLDAQGDIYATYQIDVKVGDTIPNESNYSTGDTIATLDMANPDTASGVTLDVAGDWTFDFEITTTANTMSLDQSTIVKITVSVKSA